MRTDNDLWTFLQSNSDLWPVGVGGRCVQGEGIFEGMDETRLAMS